MQNHAKYFSDYNKHCLAHILQKQESSYKREKNSLLFSAQFLPIVNSENLRLRWGETFSWNLLHSLCSNLYNSNRLCIPMEVVPHKDQIQGTNGLQSLNDFCLYQSVPLCHSSTAIILYLHVWMDMLLFSIYYIYVMDETLALLKSIRVLILTWVKQALHSMYISVPLCILWWNGKHTHNPA